MHYVYDGNAPHGHTNIPEYGQFFIYRSEDVGLAEPMLILIGLRKPNAIGISGMVVRFKTPFVGHERGIMIHGMRTFTEDAMRSTVNSTDFITVFEHEYIHMLDNNRTGDAIKAPDSSNAKEYFNDPGEFNARYHDMAKSMLAVIQAAKDEPQNVQDYVDIYGITGDWKRDLSATLTVDRHARRFVENLTPERRRALLKRLYRLHQTMMSLVHTSDRQPAISSHMPAPAPESPAHSAIAA
jgi:hypothetical protein